MAQVAPAFGTQSVQRRQAHHEYRSARKESTNEKLTFSSGSQDRMSQMRRMLLRQGETSTSGEIQDYPFKCPRSTEVHQRRRPLPWSRSLSRSSGFIRSWPTLLWLWKREQRKYDQGVSNVRGQRNRLCRSPSPNSIEYSRDSPRKGEIRSQLPRPWSSATAVSK